jgi:hypothetical protein
MRALLSTSPWCVGLLSIASSLALFACSGVSANVFPNPPEQDSAPPLSETNSEAGTFDFDGSLLHEAAPAICDPQAVGAFKPQWVPPEAWKQNVCLTSDISGYYAACLTPPIAQATCNAFIAAHSACSACLATTDTAPTAGAIVWHENDAYWTVNVAGCIARATGDPSGTGCGASYAAAIACRQQSCNACWAGQGTTTTFAEFSKCEEQSGQSTCATFADAVPAACGNLSQGKGSVCMPPSGSTAQEAFMVVAPLFCGP